ncbi:MAG: alkane 1-monooxygenase, partial [Solirubrobacterales bacterium]
MSVNAQEISADEVADDDLAWHDRKRYAWMLGLLVPTIPFGAGLLYELTGWGISWWYGPILVFLIFPFVDTIAGLDGSNPPESLIEWLENDKYYRHITYA